MVFLFVDGLGVGPPDRETNPCVHEKTGYFHVFGGQTPAPLPRGGVGFGIDATLGVEGLPQSATGQTALLTGENAARLIGRHLSGFPNEPLRKVLLEKSLLRQARERGFRPVFLNAYRPLFFELPEETVLRLSATTVANYAAGLPFFSLEDIKARRAIYQDFTNQVLIGRGFDVPLFGPEEAAAILAGAAEKYDLVLYEYFRTDRVGHKQNMQLALEVLERLGQFLDSFLSQIDLAEVSVILTSDHGNIEDVSTRSHTRNPAMTLVWGPAGEELLQKLRSIQDVSPAILELLGRNGVEKNAVRA